MARSLWTWFTTFRKNKRLLDDFEDWISINEDKQIYHKIFPEFTIRQGKIINETFSELWTDKFPDPHAHSFEVELRYFETLIHKETFVECDGDRYQIPLPKINPSNSDSKFFISKDSFAYKIAKIFGQYHPINHALNIANIELI